MCGKKIAIPKIASGETLGLPINSGANRKKRLKMAPAIAAPAITELIDFTGKYAEEAE